MLKQELDVEPLAETTQLFEAIKANQIPTCQGSRDPATNLNRQPSAIPFRFRSHRWNLRPCGNLRAAAATGRFVAHRRRGGHRQDAAAEEFIDRCGIDRAHHHRALLRRRSDFALRPVCRLLRAAFAQPDRSAPLDRLPAVWLSEAARLAPELSGLRPDLPLAPPLDNPSAQGRFFEGVTQVLLALCTRHAPRRPFFFWMISTGSMKRHSTCWCILRGGCAATRCLSSPRGAPKMCQHEHRLRTSRGGFAPVRVWANVLALHAVESGPRSRN